MDAIITRIEKLMMPVASKISSNKYLLAMRDAFSVLLPLIIAGSIFGILNWVVLDPNGTVMGSLGLNLGHKITGLTGDAYTASSFVSKLVNLQYLCNLVVTVSFGIFSLLLVISFSYRLGRLWKTDPFTSAIVGLVTFLILTPQSVIHILEDKSQITVPSSFGIGYFGSKAVLTALIVSTVSVWIFSKLQKNEKLTIKMPASVPPAVADSFKSLVPVGIILGLTALIAAALYWASQPALNDLIYTAIQTPLMGFSQGYGFAILYQLLVWGFWWLGIHGHNVTAVIQNSVYLPAQLSNQTGATSYIFTDGFFAATLMHIAGLVIAILIFSTREDWRAVCKVAAPAQVFNISEPMLFGLPIVLNPLLLIPLIVAPIVNVIIGALAIGWGLVPVFRFVVPWTMPLFFNGMISTGSLSGGILQLVWLAIDIVIYTPFVLAANKAAKIANE